MEILFNTNTQFKLPLLKCVKFIPNRTRIVIKEFDCIVYKNNWNGLLGRASRFLQGSQCAVNQRP